MHDESVLYAGMTSPLHSYALECTREMVRADFDCRSRLRGFYGLLTVPALAARVTFICLPSCTLPHPLLRPLSLHYPHKDPAFGASSICETRALSITIGLALCSLFLLSFLAGGRTIS